MFKFTKHSFVDLEKYFERINGKNYVLVDKEVIKSAVPYENGRRDTNLFLAKRTMRSNSSGEYNDISPDVIYDYLVEVERVPPNKLRANNKKGYSLEMKKKLIPLYESGKAVEFLGYYMQYASLKTRCGRMQNLLHLLHPTEYVSERGIPLFRLNYGVGIQENLRYNYNNTDLISIPKEYGPAFTVEDGYVLAWGDFAQSDFRIAYNLLIRDEQNYEIMRKYEDSYAGMAAIIADARGEKFDLEKFQEERGEFKVHILATIYGQRHGTTPEAQKFINKLAAYLDTCPRYKEFYRRLARRASLGLHVPISGYFEGGEQTLYLNEGKQSLIDKGLNTPCQTGTSQIVILCVNEILDRFYALGYTSEDVSIHHVRHDEPIFKVKKSALKDAWIFNDASTILVDDWTPLNLSFEFGTSYGVVDKNITEYVEQVYRENEHKLSAEESTPAPEEYWPVPDTYEVYIGTEAVGDKTVICFFDGKNADYALCSSTDKEDVLNTIKATLLKQEDTLYDQGYLGVCIMNNFISQDMMDRVVFYKFIQSSGSYNDNISDLLAHWVAYKYAKKNSIPFEGKEDTLRQSIDTLRAVGELNVFKG